MARRRNNPVLLGAGALGLIRFGRYDDRSFLIVFDVGEPQVADWRPLEGAALLAGTP
jgi:hypothetical protein